MKGFTLFLWFFIWTNIFECDAQPINIVPNSSFEILDTCPTSIANIIQAEHWFGAQCDYSTVPPYQYICGSGSTDYFHYCTGIIPYFTGLIGEGYQYPRTGEGMIGAGIIFIPNNQGREYLEVTLIEKLKASKKYCGSFYVNTPRTGIMVSGIGMALTKDTLLQVSTPDCIFCKLEATASIQSPINEVIKDSVGWTCVKGIYKAQGNEVMMTVGSFLPWDSVQYEAVPPYTFGSAYYFFDDFSVVELPDFSLTQSQDSICAGDSVLLSVSTSPLWNGLQHRWYTKNSNNIKDSLMLSAYVKPMQTTTYYFQFFDTINEVPCLVDYTDSVTVHVKLTYNIVLNPTDTVICAGESIAIGVDALAGLQYQWEPALYLSNAQLSKTTASPLSTIKYTLMAISDSINAQCLGINSASIQLEVAPCEPTEPPVIPGVIKYGTSLQIINLYSNSALKIYTALGQVIYENNNYQNNWQALVSAGVYLLQLRYSDAKGMLQTKEVKLLVLK